MSHDFADAFALLRAASPDESAETLRAIVDSWPPPTPGDPVAPMVRLATGFSELSTQLKFVAGMLLHLCADELDESTEYVLALLEHHLANN